MRKALSTGELKGIYARIAKRYDVQHSLITARADQRGRRLLVENSVGQDDEVLDCGAGTGTTGIMAAKKAGPNGKVTMFDLSDAMLAVARERSSKKGYKRESNFKWGIWFTCLSMTEVLMLSFRLTASARCTIRREEH
jgi:ubiquinone/menaquinone biosynthesis C-methylase UbiE